MTANIMPPNSSKEAPPPGIPAHYTKDFPPGTEVVDASGKEENIHYPTPSQNLNDPLNWSRKWKWLTNITFLWFLFWCTFPYIGTTSMYAPFIAEYGYTVEQITSFTSYTGLLNGIGNIFWIPFAMKYGRRPALLISTLGTLAASIWFPFPTSYEHKLAARIVMGFFAAPVECFGPMVIADLFFTQERSKLHSILFITALCATNIGGALSGGFADSKAGWRGFYWFTAALVASSFFLLFFFYPETSYGRSAKLSSGVVTPPQAADEKETGQIQLEDVEVNSTNLVGKGRPDKTQKFGLIKVDPTYNIAQALFRVVLIMPLAPVWMAAGWYSAIKGILVGQSYVAAQIWQAPPYNFSNAQVGMTNIPGIVGVFIGCLSFGWLSDWDLARRTRNNGGIREPEMRLWLIIPGVIIGFIGGEIYGYGAQRQWRWEILLIVGVTLNFLGFIGALVIAISYSVDTYNHLAGEIGLLLAVVANIWVFGISFFANKLLATVGFGLGITYLQLPCAFMLLVTFVFLAFGKKMRWMTANHPLLRK